MWVFVCMQPPRYDTPIVVQQAAQQVMENVDVRLLSSAFQFGRYLLFSAATAAVSNLQGLWADGKPDLPSHNFILLSIVI